MDRTHEATGQWVDVALVGERLAPLRLYCPDVERSIQRSLVQHGQMSAAVAYRDEDGRLELVDGFKRLRACRTLGRSELLVREVTLSGPQAKAAVEALNRPGGLTELEQGWLVRALYHDDGLTQPQIGLLLQRHKSWVCRRLMLVQQLDEAVQGDVRLGLLAARTAVELARLPRGNQAAVAERVARLGLTLRQTQKLVAALLGADPAQRAAILDGWVPAANGRGPAEDHRGGAPSGPAAPILMDISQLHRVAGRLHARLLERPLVSLGSEAASTVVAALRGLGPVLRVLHQEVEQMKVEEVP